MSPRVFTLPDLGEGLTEAALVRWLVSVGDEITVDQPIAEVETAKSVVEVPSPYAGVVEALHGEEGGELRVGAPLIEVEDVTASGRPIAGADSASQGRDATGGAAGDADGIEPESTGGSGNVLVGYGTANAVHTGRRRRRVSRGVDAAAADQARIASVQGPPTGSAIGSPDSGAERGPVPVISPLVRQLARTRGVDLSAVHPTGAGGVITRHDLEAASASVGATRSAPSAAGTGFDAAPPPTGAIDARTGLGIRSTAPFGMLRRTVAATMTRSRSEIPEATVWVDVDATELSELRRRIRIGERHPSLLAFVGSFALAALARYPALACRVTADGQGAIEFDGVNLGIAVDTPRGLVVPVVRRADAMTLRDLDSALLALTERARSGEATPTELTGSTFTINNYGSLGVDGSAAIINYPEVAILGLGRFIQRPWVVDGDIVPRTITQLSLVFDHRVCDGGTAAGFLRAIADDLENPYERYVDLRAG
ncbi:MAG TPA: dihydrolipoamide acetyltransferase family protein [Humibacter sp.]|nr:dihydrolipoamide acetyltransferase family protein [Humibacter sp.]